MQVCILISVSAQSKNWHGIMNIGLDSPAAKASVRKNDKLNCALTFTSSLTKLYTYKDEWGDCVYHPYV